MPRAQGRLWHPGSAAPGSGPWGDRGRVVVEIASFNPPDQPRTYLVVLWEIDTVTIRFKDVANLQAACDFFAAY